MLSITVFASDNWGTHFGDTKDVASIVLNPV